LDDNFLQGFYFMDQTALCLDIGSGTQDVLYYIPQRELENCPKFILPSPAVMVARRLEELGRRNKSVYLYGYNMGGGFARVLRKHLQAGLKAAVHPEAAYAMSDSPDNVRAMGVEITKNCPPGFAPVYLADFDPGFWQGFLAQAGLEYPEVILASAQDHGFHPGGSNRLGRFEIWRKFLSREHGDLKKLIFDVPPEEMTRLISLKQCMGGGLVCDTGAAALLGALSVPEVEELSQQQGICVVNAGNSHTIAFLVYRGRVMGIYEHHTGMLDGEKLWAQLESFRAGRLTNEEVFEDRGHGCRVLDEAAGMEFGPVFLLGPRRRLLEGFQAHFLCPGGDMMLAGCFGMLKGAALLKGQKFNA